MFADDCVLYSEVKSRNDQIALNNNLNKIYKWCNDWQMTLNENKCVCMTISRKKLPLDFNYELSGHKLNKVTTFKYLGVIFSSELKWDPHIDYIIKRANSKLWFLKRTLPGAPPSTKLLAYKTLIRPILEYASVVWDPFTQKNINKLEMIQRKALRFIFNKFGRKNSPSKLMLQTDLTSLASRRKIARLKMLYLIVNGTIRIPQDKYIAFSQRTNTRFTHPKTIIECHSRVDAFKYSFFPRTVSDWNKLPRDIVNCDCVSSFLEQLLSTV